MTDGDMTRGSPRRSGSCWPAVSSLPPEIDESGGGPYGIWWSFSWMDAPGGLGDEDRTISLRLRTPDLQDGEDDRSFGWGMPYPDRGVTVRAAAVLESLSGDWMRRVVEPWNPSERFTRDLRGDMIQAGDAPSGLTPFVIGIDDRGIHVTDGSRCFAPGTESVLTVEALLGLGDAISRGLLARPPESKDKKTAELWTTTRRTDGFRPLSPEREDFTRDPVFVRRTAEWFAGKIGMDPGTYVRAVAWEAATHALLSGIYQHATGMEAYDGLRAARLNLLPSEDGLRRMVEAVLPETSDIWNAHDVDAWATAALEQANSDLWGLVYYRHWRERRSWSVAELEITSSQADRLQTWADRIATALRSGCPLPRSPTA